MFIIFEVVDFTNEDEERIPTAINTMAIAMLSPIDEVNDLYKLHLAADDKYVVELDEEGLKSLQEQIDFVEVQVVHSDMGTVDNCLIVPHHVNYFAPLGEYFSTIGIGADDIFIASVKFDKLFETFKAAV